MDVRCSITTDKVLLWHTLLLICFINTSYAMQQKTFYWSLTMIRLLFSCVGVIAAPNECQRILWSIELLMGNGCSGSIYNDVMILWWRARWNLNWCSIIRLPLKFGETQKLSYTGCMWNINSNLNILISEASKNHFSFHIFENLCKIMKFNPKMLFSIVWSMRSDFNAIPQDQLCTCSPSEADKTFV